MSQILPTTRKEHPDHNYSVGALKKIPNLNGYEAYLGKIYDGKKQIGFFEDDTHGGYPHFDFKEGKDWRAFKEVAEASSAKDIEFFLSDLVTEKAFTTELKRKASRGILAVARSAVFHDKGEGGSYPLVELRLSGSKVPISAQRVQEILGMPVGESLKAEGDMVFTNDKGWVSI